MVPLVDTSFAPLPNTASSRTESSHILIPSQDLFHWKVATDRETHASMTLGAVEGDNAPDAVPRPECVRHGIEGKRCHRLGVEIPLGSYWWNGPVRGSHRAQHAADAFESRLGAVTMTRVSESKKVIQSRMR